MRLPPTAIAGQATFEGCIAGMRLPGLALERGLPPELQLTSDSSGDVSCLLLFGQQREGTAFVAGVPIPWGGRYHELMVAVPYVRSTRTGVMYLFVLGMLCDAWWAAWNGNAYYGFRKRLAPITWDGRQFTVSGQGDRDEFRAVVRARMAPPASTAHLQAASALPVLGHRYDGRLVRSRFEWDFGAEVVEPATVWLDVGQSFREIPTTTAIACDQAVRVHAMRWRLSWPVPE